MYLGAHVARLADLIKMLTLNRTSGAESQLLGELEANPYPKTRRRRATWSWPGHYRRGRREGLTTEER